MATATIVKVWHDTASVYVAAAVSETQTVWDDIAGKYVSGPHTVEYLASCVITDSQGNPLTLAQLKLNLIAALQAVRNAALGTGSVSVVGISGTVTI